MSNKILVTIPIHAGDAALAEQLIDFIFHQNHRVKRGHVLLVYAPDVHEEMRLKLKISAEVAFESVNELATKFTASQQKSANVNNMFVQAARYMNRSFRWPWLWMEPDCVPMIDSWLDDISEAYENQPRSYMGNYMLLGGQVPQRFMGRVGVYPNDAVMVLSAHCGTDAPFERVAGADIIPMCTKTRLIQHLPFIGEDDRSKIWKETVLLHGDKTGHLIAQMRERFLDNIPNGSEISIPAEKLTFEKLQELNRLVDKGNEYHHSFPTPSEEAGLEAVTASIQSEKLTIESKEPFRDKSKVQKSSTPTPETVSWCPPVTCGVGSIVPPTQKFKRSPGRPRKIT